jgi:hypothetical protein
MNTLHEVIFSYRRNTINKFLIPDPAYGWKNYNNKKPNLRRINKLTVRHDKKMSNNNNNNYMFLPIINEAKMF